mmetsp:Transcript_104967/g.192413  ORF Transcript_104967/g.192413 Transcript_104967/m.192413 type:complete len:275 (-) Transcript_104967:484-1308(-)
MLPSPSQAGKAVGNSEAGPLHVGAVGQSDMSMSFPLASLSRALLSTGNALLKGVDNAGKEPEPWPAFSEASTNSSAKEVATGTLATGVPDAGTPPTVSSMSEFTCSLEMEELVTGTPTSATRISATRAKKPAAGEIASVSADGRTPASGEGPWTSAKKPFAGDEIPAEGTLDDIRPAAGQVAATAAGKYAPGAGAVAPTSTDSPGPAAVGEAGAVSAVALFAEGKMLAAGTLDDETPAVEEAAAASLGALAVVGGRSSAAGTLADEALELLPAS